MPVYKIAGLNVAYEPRYDLLRDRSEKYRCDEKADFRIGVSDSLMEQQMEYYKDVLEGAGLEYLWVGSAFNLKLLEYNGMFLHSSTVVADGKAYSFSAPCSTGKSTHTALWQKHFGDRVTMINDDKPIIRRCGGRFYVYGTPWMGKANIGTNTKAPLKAVYILERAKENRAARVLPSQVLRQLFEAAVIDVERSRMERLLELFDGCFSVTPLFLLGCNMEDGAVITAYNAANGKDK